MKVDLKHYTKEFFEEYYYTAANRPQILKTPRKIRKITQSLLITAILFSVLVIISWCVSYRGEIYLLILNILLTLFAIGLFVFIYLIRTRIQRLVDEKPHGHLEINADGVILKASHEPETSLSWERIKYVIINPNSILFIPTDKNTPFIGVPANEKDKIVDEINKLEYYEKVRDNTTK